VLDPAVKVIYAVAASGKTERSIDKKHSPSGLKNYAINLVVLSARTVLAVDTLAGIN
jgi:hypothetical protein